MLIVGHDQTGAPLLLMIANLRGATQRKILKKEKARHNMTRPLNAAISIRESGVFTRQEKTVCLSVCLSVQSASHWSTTPVKRPVF